MTDSASDISEAEEKELITGYIQKPLSVEKFENALNKFKKPI